MKCKQAIEELHLELEGEKRLRQQVEDSLMEAENESQEKESESVSMISFPTLFLYSPKACYPEE